MARRLRRMLAYLVAASAASWPSAATADWRVLEQASDGRVVRYLDLFGYGQPGFIWRQNDPLAPIDDDALLVQTLRTGFHAQLHPMVELKGELELFPSPSLADGYAQGNFFPWLKVRLGQFKVPYLRTYQFSSTALGFNDRLTYTALAPDRSVLAFLKERDVGLMIHGRIGSEDTRKLVPVVEYFLGMFLGRGPNQARNDDDAFLYSARVELHALGLPAGARHEGDLAKNRLPKLMAGAAVYTNCDDRGNWNRGFTTDLELRWRGLYASGSVVWIKNGPSTGLGSTLGYDGACQGVQGLGDFISSGWHAQLQYVLPLPPRVFRKHAIELGARWDSVSPNSPCDKETGRCGVFGGGETTPGYVAPPNYGDSDNGPTRGRLTVGINYYPTSEPLMKVQTNYQHKRELEDVVLPEGVSRGIKDDVFWLQVTAGF